MGSRHSWAESLGRGSRQSRLCRPSGAGSALPRAPSRHRLCREHTTLCRVGPALGTGVDSGSVYMRRCSLGHILYGDKACSPLNLRRVTIAECSNSHGRLGFMPAPSLCSFRYMDSFLGLLFFLPKDAALTDLYICFSDPQPILPQSYDYKLETALPDDLSGLSVLTISSALKVCSL
jgi:hypothetical protein